MRRAFSRRSAAMLIPALAAFLAVSTSAPATARAEVDTVRISRQPSLNYLALMVMEDRQLLEKTARAAGLGDIKVEWLVVAGGNASNEALLSGNLDFASAGVPVFLTVWDRTRNAANPIKAVAAYNAAPTILNTNNPNVKTIDDFTGADRIAVPAVKVSYPALILQMAAAKRYGDENYTKLDHLTVSLPQVDANQMLLSGTGGITANFASPPTMYEQMRSPGITTVLHSYDVLGGPATLGIVYTAASFRYGNPKTYQAFLDAYQEAVDFIASDPDGAAEVYLRITGDSRSTPEFIKSMIEDPQIDFELTPKGMGRYADFMHKVKILREKPADWKELFFPEIHHLPGS